jgi:hypothetical protein
MSTYVPKNSRIPHKPLNHSVHDTPEIKRKRVLLWAAIILLGPALLLGGLAVLWWAVAWIIVGVFHVLPLFKA